MNIQTIKSEVKKVFGSKIFKGVIYVLGIFIVASFIFRAGVFVGFNRASFGHDWNDKYTENFGPAQRGKFMMGDNFDNSRDMPNAHGAIGKIIKIELPTIIVMDDKDQVEKVILINDKTDIREMREKINKEDFKVDDFIVVIGSPNQQGQIEAKLIRILPAPMFDNNNLPVNPNITPVKK